MRALLAVALLLPGMAAAEAWHDAGRPDQCGQYEQSSYDREIWFPGGEGSAVALTDRQPVRGLNAVLSEGVVVEEGLSEPMGRVLVTRGLLLSASEPPAGEVLVIVTEAGIRVLQRCP